MPTNKTSGVVSEIVLVLNCTCNWNNLFGLNIVLYKRRVMQMPHCYGSSHLGPTSWLGEKQEVEEKKGERRREKEG